MSLISVFRVEHRENGGGPFSSEKCIDFICDALNCNLDKFPGPWRDGIERFSSNHHFGFRNLETLVQWMTPFKKKKARKRALNALEERDFVVREYIVSEKTVKDGKSGMQTAFKKDCHKGILTHDISILRDVAKEQQLI